VFAVETRGDVDVVRMDDGKVNVMNANFVARFAKTWRQVHAGGRAVVLAGNDRAFSAGLDLKALPLMSEERTVTFARDFMRLFRDVLAHPRPVVALVDGPAIAGGAVLALSADLRVATPRAKIGLTEVPVGIPFPKPVLDLARSRLPREEHAPALLRGLVREGDRCVADGWVHEMAPSADALDKAVALAQELAEMNPLAYRGAKQDMSKWVIDSFDDFEKNGAEAWAAALMRPETREALARTLDRLARK